MSSYTYEIVGVSQRNIDLRATELARDVVKGLKSGDAIDLGPRACASESLMHQIRGELYSQDLILADREPTTPIDAGWQSYSVCAR